MENKLQNSVQELLNKDGVQGVIVSDNKGLCLAVGGVGTESSSGVWSALFNEANKLEPDLPSPTLVFENNKRQCIVQGNERLVISVYKDKI